MSLRAYAVSFGGNAVTAAFCCAKLGIVPDLIATVANDWLGRMFQDMSAKYGIAIHPRKVNASSLSFIMPKDGKRAIVRCRDDEHIHPFPMLNLRGCRALHVDGHQPDAAIHYAKLCREDGILTSLDGGGLRTNTHELLEFIDVAIVAERLCEQMDMTPEKMLDYLKSRGCRVGGVTQGEKGLLWYDETGAVRTMPAYPIPPERVIDTNGAGDVFHGAYIYSYLANPEQRLEGSFRVRARRIDLQDSAPRQRSRIADPGRYRNRQAGVSGRAQEGVLGLGMGRAFVAGSRCRQLAHLRKNYFSIPMVRGSHSVSSGISVIAISDISSGISHGRIAMVVRSIDSFAIRDSTNSTMPSGGCSRPIIRLSVITTPK